MGPASTQPPTSSGLQWRRSHLRHGRAWQRAHPPSSTREHKRKHPESKVTSRRARRPSCTERIQPSEEKKQKRRRPFRPGHFDPSRKHKCNRQHGGQEHSREGRCEKQPFYELKSTRVAVASQTRPRGLPLRNSRANKTLGAPTHRLKSIGARRTGSTWHRKRQAAASWKAMQRAGAATEHG
jgi:hypothetical protein